MSIGFQVMILNIIIGFQVVFYGRRMQPKYFGSSFERISWILICNVYLYRNLIVRIYDLHKPWSPWGPSSAAVSAGHIFLRCVDVSMHIAVVKLHVAGLWIPTLPTAICTVDCSREMTNQPTGSHRRTTLMFPANPWPLWLTDCPSKTCKRS